MNTQDIIPVTLTTSVDVTNFNVEVTRLELFKAAFLQVYMCDENGVRVKSCVLNMQGDDYLNWSNNDHYVYEFVARELNFTLQ